MSTLNLRAVLGFEGRGFEVGMSKAANTVNRFGGQVMGDVKSRIAAAFSVGAVIAFTKSVVDAGSAIVDSAERLGLTNSEYQKFAFAAEQGGLDNNAFAASFDRLTSTIQDAKTKGGEALETFKRLGVSLSDLKTKSAGEVFQQISDSVAGMNVDDQLRADLLDAFGKSGTKLIPVFKELRETVKEAPLFTDGELKRLDQAGDRMNTFWKTAQVGGAGFTVMMDALAQTLLSLPDDIAGRVAGPAKMGFLEHFFLPDDASSRASDLRVSGGMLAKKQADKKANAPEVKTAQQLKEEEKERNKVTEESIKLKERLADVQFAGMSAEEQLVALEKEKVKYQQDYWDAVSGSNDELKAQIGLQETTNKIEDIKTSMGKRGGKMASSIRTDSLVSVGNFLGGGSTTIVSIQQKQLEYAKDMSGSLRTLVKVVSRPSSGGLSSITPST